MVLPLITQIRKSWIGKSWRLVLLAVMVWVPVAGQEQAEDPFLKYTHGSAFELVKTNTDWIYYSSGMNGSGFFLRIKGLDVSKNTISVWTREYNKGKNEILLSHFKVRIEEKEICLDNVIRYNYKNGNLAGNYSWPCDFEAIVPDSNCDCLCDRLKLIKQFVEMSIWKTVK
jgi:hypothetical protein